MDRIEIARGAGPTLDSCARHGVWLDAGELDELRRWAQTNEAIRLEKLHRTAPLFPDRPRIEFGRDLSCMRGPSRSEAALWGELEDLLLRFPRDVLR